MSDIEQRARDALNSVYDERYCDGERATYYDENVTRRRLFIMEAMCREIEEHDATKAELADLKREVSDAAKLHIAEAERCYSALWASVTRDAFSRFIQPDPVKVDPLVEALRDWSESDMGFVEAESLREALAKRGLTITEGDAK